MGAGQFLRLGKGRGSATAQTAAPFPRGGEGPRPAPPQAPAMEPRTRPRLQSEPGHAKSAPRGKRGTVPPPRERGLDPSRCQARGRSSATGKAVEAPRPKQQRLSRAAGKREGIAPAQAPAWNPEHGQGSNPNPATQNRPHAASAGPFLRHGKGAWTRPDAKHRPWNPEHGQSPARAQATQNRPRAMSAGPFLRHGKGRGSAPARTAAPFPRLGKGTWTRPAPSTGYEPQIRPSPRPSPGHAKPAPRAERGAGPLRRDARENRPARSAAAAF